MIKDVRGEKHPKIATVSEAFSRHLTYSALKSGSLSETDMNDTKDNPDEGGHMSSRFGRIVRTADPQLPYKAILTHDECAETECSFATMHEAEAFIRRNTPRPRARSTFWDRDGPEG